MRRLPFLAVAAAVSAATWLSASSASDVRGGADLYVMPQAQEQSLSVTMINRPGAPPHIAVPPFVVLTADQTTQDASKTLTDVLSADLKFEREFDVMPATSYAGVPSSQSIEGLPYDRWAQLGADFVAIGTVKAAAGGKFEVELRVVSIKERRQSYGEGFSGMTRDLRRIAHTASDEIHKNLRGVDGVARTRIAFSSTRDGERYGKTVEERSAKEIYIMDYDGANQQKVTANHSLNISASWCPDGQCLAYMTYSPFPDIIVQNIFGQIGMSQPTHGTDKVQNYLPRFSPDGTKIAFGSTRNGDAMDIYVVNRDGTGERRLTNNPAIDSAPTWSPSGNLIAFTSNRTGSNQIYTMSPDGTQVRRVENSCSHCDRPTFAPGLSGLLLAYSTQTAAAGHDIELYDYNTQQARRLTNGEGTNESPSFAPNGRHVLFFTTRWGKEQLAIVDIDGKNVRRLTIDGANTYPNWSGFLK
jgi:TolB protein